MIISVGDVKLTLFSVLEAGLITGGGGGGGSFSITTSFLIPYK